MLRLSITKIVLLLLVAACNNSSKYTGSNHITVITESITLTSDLQNQAFDVRCSEPCVVDLNGYKMTGAHDGKTSAFYVRSSDVTIKNSNSSGGGIYGFSVGITHRGNITPEDIPLIRVENVEALRDRQPSGLIVKDMHFHDQEKHAIFIDKFTTKWAITGNYFGHAGRSAIYFEHGSAYGMTAKNAFVNNGHGEYDDKKLFGTTVYSGRKRFQVSIDGSQHGVLWDNEFYQSHLGHIGTWMNCGERLDGGDYMRRVTGADYNEIFENGFDGGTAVYLNYRRDNNHVDDCLGLASRSDYNSVHDNYNFDGSPVLIFNDGIGNEINH